MKVKYIWFNPDEKKMMDLSWKWWAARNPASPGSVKISVLSLWKSRSIALILPAHLFNPRELSALSGGPDGPPGPPPLSQKELPL
jgi:hypothetical protein